MWSGVLLAKWSIPILENMMTPFTHSAPFESLKAIRLNVVKILSDLPKERLLKIPQGFNNHLLWHAGHILVSQQSLCYALSGLPLPISSHLLPLFRKGSSPREWEGEVDIAEVRALLDSTIGQLEKDYAAGVFKAYKPYTTSFGVALNNVEDAILFDHVHEGTHFGLMLSMMKLV
jgi:hypothetical protein